MGGYSIVGQGCMRLSLVQHLEAIQMQGAKMEGCMRSDVTIELDGKLATPHHQSECGGFGNFFFFFCWGE